MERGRVLLSRVLVLSLSLAASAQAATLCDPNLPSEPKSPLAYKERNGRCEGIYAQEVSAVSVDVRSVLAGFGSFDPGRDEHLPLAWTAPPGESGNLRLRAFSFRPRTYFRMDTELPASQGVFSWPTDVLSQLNLDEETLGLLAWMDLPGSSGTRREVYLPLRAAGGSGSAADGYQIAVVPSVRLREIHVTLTRLDRKGGAAAVLRQNEPLEYGNYPSNQPTVFDTGRLGEEGFYRLEIAATPVSGPPVRQEIELYHSGR